MKPNEYSNVQDEKDFIGKTIIEISNVDDEIIFTCLGGSKYIMYHNQDCCETVKVDKIRGALDNLLNKVVQSFRTWTSNIPDANESGTATYFEITMENNSARSIIKWTGYSNGYYSEGVKFERLSQ